jgi:hypothetical protein
MDHAVGRDGAIMSEWEAERTERNNRSLTRLTKALPEIFPSAVLTRALDRPFVPPTPRLAVDSYWSAHPIRAERLARALAARSGAPSGWTWRIGNGRNRLSPSFRTPPAPFREPAYAKGPGYCCVCGQSVCRLPRSGGSRRRRGRALRACSRINRSMRCRPHDIPSAKRSCHTRLAP